MNAARAIEVVAWRSAGGVDYRLEILERSDGDGLFTLRLLRHHDPVETEHGADPGGWMEVPLDVVRCDTLERARELSADEKRRR